MAASLHFLVCQNYAREVAAVINAEGWTDVTVAPLEGMCAPPRSEPQMIARQAFALPPPEGGTVFLLGACGLFARGGQALTEDARHRIHREDLCFNMFLPKNLVDHSLRAGAYLVTPGWLDRWRHHIDSWKFDQITARDFFSETTKRLLLLDTGLDPGAAENLAACADYLGLPAETLPVGLDHFRLLLRGLVQQWRAEEARREAEVIRTRDIRKLADHVTAMDLLAKLARLMDEEEAVRGVQDLFAMLFGATFVRFTPAGSGAQAAGNATGIERDWITRLGGDGEYATFETGFCVRVVQKTETLGFLCVEIPRFQEHRDDYLNLALSVVNVCGLAIANARAMTLRRRAEEAVRVKSEELARSNADLEQFAHTASHDLQAPLRRIIGFGDLLERQMAASLPEKAKGYLDAMKISASRMQQLIAALLAYARVSTSAQPFAPVALSSVIKNVLEDVAPRIEETRARVDVGDLPVVQADAMQMYQLLQNLMTNALKFIAPGRVPHVCVSSRRINAGQVEVSVSDNGVGFDEEDMPKLFRAFQRLHSETNFPGSGIGLASCHKIIQRHGGSITARGRVGQGATFIFTLPSDAKECGPACPAAIRPV